MQAQMGAEPVNQIVHVASQGSVSVGLLEQLWTSLGGGTYAEEP